MMERGEFTATKVRNTQTVKANMVIFATSNSTERLSKPLLSRFTVLEIPEYTYEEFEAISVRIIKKTTSECDNTNSFISLENRQQRYKRCFEDCQIM
jgi:ATP-dependent Lon protease